MQVELVHKIKNNPPLYHYLKYNSYWYKDLNRNPSSFTELENEMKKEYKLTAADRIASFGDKINMVQAFLDVLK